MLHIRISVYKPSGKWYTSGEATSEENIPLWDDAFKQFVREHLPAQIDGGYVVVNDCEGGEGFHNVLLSMRSFSPEKAAKRLSLGDSIYYIAHAKAPWVPLYQYKTYVEEKTINRIELTKGHVVYTAGQHNECVFEIDGDVGRVFPNPEFGEKVVYLSQEAAQSAMEAEA